jgi:hypothetical protein
VRDWRGNWLFWSNGAMKKREKERQSDKRRKGWIEVGSGSHPPSDTLARVACLEARLQVEKKREK